MEIEINHPPIKCPACGHINKTDAIAISRVVQDNEGVLDALISNSTENANAIFYCQKCPTVRILKRAIFGDETFWELPS